MRVIYTVVKLREERQLLARFLVIQQSRNLNLQDAIGSYEMSIIPRSLFANDGSLLTPNKKSAIISLIEKLPLPHEICFQEAHNETTVSSVESYESSVDSTQRSSPQESIAIIDAMAIVQSLKKTPTMKKMSDLLLVFCKKIENRAKGYSETRVVFDEYYDASLKAKTRAKRAKAKKATIEISYRMNDHMSLSYVTLKDLLTSTKTKRSLTKYLADGLLTQKSFQGRLIVVQGGTARSENCAVSEEVLSHSHEEADTLIPLHALDAMKDDKRKLIVVHCADTDILTLLVDLVANDRHSESSKIHIEKTGKSSGNIDIMSRVQAIGLAKAKGLVGFHNFSGGDYGGKFVGISKETWMKAFLALPDDDDVVLCFQQLGTFKLTVADFSGSLPSSVSPLEKFLCSVYAPDNCVIRKIPDLRWELFRTKNLEGEKLPPTLPTFFLHILRCNFVTMRDKSYTNAHPTLPPLTETGWEIVDGTIVPMRCLSPPAPKAVLELVKCGCDPVKGCKNKCSCVKNNLPCTPLCKCYVAGCENLLTNYHRDSDYVQDEEEEQ